MHRTALFFHLIAFAAYMGAGFAQQRFLRASRGHGLPTSVRDHYEQLAAIVVTKIELPAIFVSVVSGVGLILATPEVMRQGWLHAKLACVAMLLVLSHVEMFNARTIVKLRDKGDTAEIDKRKGRHAAFGAVGSLLVAVVLVLVAFAR